MQELPPGFKIVGAPQQRNDRVIAPPDPYKQQTATIQAQTNERQERNDARDATTTDLTNQVTQLNIRDKLNAAEAKETEARTLEGGMKNSADSVKRTVEILKGIRKDASDNAMSPGLGETGTSGNFMRGVPLFSNAGKDLAGKVKAVKGLNAFSALKDLAAQGVKLTPISNAEIDLAASSVANIDPELSQEEFVSAIDQAIAFHKDAYGKIMMGLNGGKSGPEVLTEAVKSGASKEEILQMADLYNLDVNEAELDANLQSRAAGGPTSKVLPPDIAAIAAAAMQKYGQ